MICLLAAIAVLNPGDASRVLVIENAASEASVEIATDYAKARKTPAILKVSCQDSAVETAKETMPYAEFKVSIEAPLRAYLKTHQGIDFIVLTKGIPIRLTGAPTGVGNNQPSLDSTIASLDYADRKDTSLITLNDSGFTGKAWINRFWNSNERFTHRKFGGYLVTRLDAYTTAEAVLLSRYSLQAEAKKQDGHFLIDVAEGHGLGDTSKVPLSVALAKAAGTGTLGEMNYNDWDADLVVAGDTLKKKGVPVVVDRTDTFIGRKGDLLGYASWGSNDPKFDGEGYKLLRFEPGAIAETAVSTSARTFLPTTGGQSLIADLIHGRVTGIKGYCDEPLLQAVASPTVLFDRYTRGWTLAESFYAASRLTGWEDIVVGDPLCAPYAKR